MSGSTEAAGRRQKKGGSGNISTISSGWEETLKSGTQTHARRVAAAHTQTPDTSAVGEEVSSSTRQVCSVTFPFFDIYIFAAYIQLHLALRCVLIVDEPRCFGSVLPHRAFSPPCVLVTL